MLKGAGKDFNFMELATKAPFPELDNRKPRWTSKEKQYYCAIMVFLVLFSLVILMCCVSVLCGKKIGEKIWGKH